MPIPWSWGERPRAVSIRPPAAQAPELRRPVRGRCCFESPCFVSGRRPSCITATHDVGQPSVAWTPRGVGESTEVTYA